MIMVDLAYAFPDTDVRSLCNTVRAYALFISVNLYLN